jgi:iron complex transport system substrate-binding protein
MLVSTISFAHEITIKDAFGRTVHTPENVTKIVAIGPGALRFIVYAGAQDMVVGRELFEDKLSKSLRPYTYALPKNFNDLPVISTGGPGKMPDIEKLILANPDVIFAAAFTADQMDTIQRKTNIPVVGLNYGKVGHTQFDMLKDSLRTVGYVTHKQLVTQHILNTMALLRKDIMRRVEGAEPKTVYMASVAFKGARGFNSTESHHPSCGMLGVTNIADLLSGKSGHVMMQIETILKMQPEHIFFDVTGLNALKKNYANEVKTLNLLNAVKEGKSYTVLPYNWYNSNVENIFLTTYFMGKMIYPDRFSDVDVAHYADEIYNKFLHINPYEDIVSKNQAYRGITFEKDGISFGK